MNTCAPTEMPCRGYYRQLLDPIPLPNPPVLRLDPLKGLQSLLLC